MIAQFYWTVLDIGQLHVNLLQASELVSLFLVVRDFSSQNSEKKNKQTKQSKVRWTILIE